VEAIYWLLSRNETKQEYKCSEEERLLEFLAEMNRAYQLDLTKLREKEKDKTPVTVEPGKRNVVEEDSRRQYPKFMEALKEKAEAYKYVSTEFRKLSCMPSLVLSLVMASRVRKHYTHAPWFKIATLNQMVEVHGAVSAISKLTLSGY
jgi:hypothetical protein